MRDVRVVEIGGSIAGAYCGRLFAAAGSDVVLVERPGHPGLRAVAPFVEDASGDGNENGAGAGGSSATHEYLNASKRSVSLPFDDPALEDPVLDELFRWADVVISTSDGTPDEARRLHRRVEAANAAAVHVVVSGFGLTGPYAHWRNTPITDWACGGYLYLNGDPDREPLQGGGPWASCLAGATAAVGAQAALLERTCTGRGQLVDVGAMEATAAGHQWTLTMYTHTGVVKKRWGARFGEAYHPMSLYECADGWICVGAALLEQWERMCIAVDRPDLLVDERLYAPAERFDRADEVDAAFQPWFSARTADEAVEALQEAHVPAGRAQTFAEVLDAPQLAGRHFWAPLPWLGPNAKMPGAPFRVAARAGVGDAEGEGDSDSDGGGEITVRRAPAHGADTVDVMADVRAANGTGRRPFPRVDLRRMKAVEVTVAWAGPLTARFLGDLGVDVVKVEHPAARGVGPLPPAVPGWQWGTLPDPQLRAALFPHAEPGERWWNRIGVWNKMNRNKRDLCLDAKHDEGRQVLDRLVEQCDIVVHNFTPQAAASLGLDAAGVARHNDRAVTVLMSGYGETGPMAAHASWGPILEAFGGFDEATGYADAGPMRLGLAFPDALGGVHGAFAALAGLWERERVDASVHIDLSQLETLLCVAGESLIAASVSKSAPARMGNRSVQHAPQGVYRCAGEDAWVAITVQTDDEWRRFVELTGDRALSPLAGATVTERRARHDEIDEAISSWTASLTALEIASRLQDGGIAACPVFTNRDLVENEHLAARGFMVTWDQPDAGPQTFPGFPIHFDCLAVDMRPAPALGADNDRVLQELGYDRPSIERLHERGVVADRPPS